MSVRRFAARLLVAAVLVGGAVPLMAGTAWACVCDGYGDGSEQAEYRGVAGEARLAYTGLVAARHSPTPPPPGSPPRPPGDTRYTVRVEERLKGSVAATREIASSSSSCGVQLEPGRRALVVEFTGDGQIGTCDGTTQHRVDERAAIVRDELRRRTLADTGPPAWPAAIAALRAAAALVGRNRRRRSCVVPA